MKVKSRMSCPVRRKDGTWTTVIKDFEEDIPDLGREELICNKCGRPDYPKCKETVCEAWKYHKTMCFDCLFCLRQRQLDIQINQAIALVNRNHRRKKYDTERLSAGSSSHSPRRFTA